MSALHPWRARLYQRLLDETRPSTWIVAGGLRTLGESDRVAVELRDVLGRLVAPSVFAGHLLAAEEER